ncbi:MAG: peroxiredoxin [Methylococcales bacterium]|nr:peroxiredoxin [Methylococcales bacterium]
MKNITQGDSVPNFTAVTTNDKTIQLSDYLGKNVVLYFYPKDNTPGCTQEAQDFRDSYKKFETLNTVIFGISRDSVRSHEGFKCKQSLPFDLISDHDETLCQLFDVLKTKNMYGKQVIGIERSTFLIDTQGTLVHEWRKVKVEGHCLEVLEKIGSI